MTIVLSAWAETLDIPAKTNPTCAIKADSFTYIFSFAADRKSQSNGLHRLSRHLYLYNINAAVIHIPTY
jgi:hypothetical protein